MTSSRENIRVVVVFERPIKFEDVDAAGIVFFARFVTYAHEAMEDFFSTLEGGYPRLIIEASGRHARGAPRRVVQGPCALWRTRFGFQTSVGKVAIGARC